MSPYAALNPFAVTSVGENDLWNASAFLDVPHINAASFATLKMAVDQVRANRRSVVRFVRGAGGSGKSHLFARLHRECGDTIFYAYAPNPPLQPEALESFLLSRFVSSLRHPARGTDGKPAPYSQLRLLAYALLKPVIEQPYTLPELHAQWARIDLDTRKELIHQAVQLLEEDHPMVPRNVLRCILTVLREDKEHLAAQWLAGAAYLTDADLTYLGVTDSLARADMGIVIQLFGKLAAQAGAPVVLALDQLDLLITQPQFDEMQRLLFSLIDQSENWVILVGLVVERYAMWDGALAQALRGRIGVPDGNAPQGFRLPVVDVLPLINEQKRQLLACRLESPVLVAQRKKDGITSEIYPLQEEDMVRLTSGGAIFPRHLLAAAAEAFDQRVLQAEKVVHLPADVVSAASTVPSPVPAVPPVGITPAAVSPPPTAIPVAVPVPAIAVPPAVVAPVAAVVEAVAVPIVSKVPLAEKIDTLLQEAMLETNKDTAAPSAIDLAERTRDLIELMAVPPVTYVDGDIRRTYDNFDGSDRWFTWGGQQVRIVTSNAMRGSFIAVLERLKEAGGDTLLLRHVTAPVAGQHTLELLNGFKARNVFHHVAESEAALLDALGRMLAALREGSYDQLPTEPPATKDNVLAALRSHTMLRHIRLWEMVQKAHAPKLPKNSPPLPSVLSSIARPQPAVPGMTAEPTAVPPPPVMPSASVAVPPPPSVTTAAPAFVPPPPPPTASPLAAVVAGNHVPVAKPPQASVVVPSGKLPQKPVARPPAPPSAKLPAPKPPPTTPRPPMGQLPPPSQGTAA